MPTILIVDDETLLLKSLADGLAGLDPALRVLTAENGNAACRQLAAHDVDLVLTDLRMPEMDGFALLAWMSAHRPNTPALVMTAFGDNRIAARLRELGIDGCIEKPADFDRLAGSIRRKLSEPASGTIRGISLPTFLQAIEIDRKSCGVRVSTEHGDGTLTFVRGELYDAVLGDLTGIDAARLVVRTEQPTIALLPARRAPPRRIHDSLSQIILESFKDLDEAARDARQDSARHALLGTDAGEPTNKETTMSIQDKLKEFNSLDGFLGTGVFTPTGEALAIHAPTGTFNKEIGVLANNVLMNAQKASIEMGAGRGQQVHVVGEKAHILVRCVNEGNDPLKSEPGKAHIHVVLALENDNQIGLAKMKLNSVATAVAPELRA